MHKIVFVLVCVYSTCCVVKLMIVGLSCFMSMNKQVLEILDPGCGGKLLASKLANDEIPQERYENLKEFVDRLQYGEGELDEATMENRFIDDHDEDDIEVHVCNFQCLLLCMALWE